VPTIRLHHIFLRVTFCVGVHPRVYEALSKPVVGPLDPYFIQVMGDVQQLLKMAFATRDAATLVISGTGIAGMEGADTKLFQSELDIALRSVVCIAALFDLQMVSIVFFIAK
jgi:alanine-glyoxylate transaminase/serine-glyoxylate transaminase/serine-pyruvate transaminase